MSRLLKLNDEGTDVLEATKLLVSRGYLDRARNTFDRGAARRC